MARETLQKRLAILIKLSPLQRLQCLRKKKGKKAREFWVFGVFKNRDSYGVFTTLFEELKSDREYFFQYLRMSLDRFKHLLDLIRPAIEKSDTKFRKETLCIGHHTILRANISCPLTFDPSSLLQVFTNSRGLGPKFSLLTTVTVFDYCIFLIYPCFPLIMFTRKTLQLLPSYYR